MSLVWLLMACSTPPEPAADPASAFADSLPAPQARACFEAACAGTGDDPAGCFASACPERQDGWELVPEKVQWDEAEGIFFLEAHVDYTAGGWGEIDVVRQEPVFIGVTLITPEDEEIDLAIATRFPGAFGERFFISSEVDRPVRDLIVGVWDRKIEPCDHERMGCQLFGFLLDGRLASWPPDFYETKERQRIPPSSYEVLPRSGGASVADLDAATQRAVQGLEAMLAPFGSAVKVGAPAVAEAVPERSTLRYSAPHDIALARMVVEHLGGEAGGWVRGEPLEGEPRDVLELVVAGDAAHHACLAEHCAKAGDLAACEAASCQ